MLNLFFFFSFCFLKACAELVEGAVWRLKRPSSLGSGMGKPGEGGVSLCPRPRGSKARANFVKYKTGRDDGREICKIQYLRGLAIIKNKVHYLQTISVLGLCTVGDGGV